MTTAIRKEQARRHSPVCRCDAYDWPHREYNSLCQGQDGPLGFWPTPAGTRQPGKMHWREERALFRRYGFPFG